MSGPAGKPRASRSAPGQELRHQLHRRHGHRLVRGEAVGVQGLVAAQLAHDLGRAGESHEALLQALERAKAVVTRSLEELRSAGLTTEQLIRDTASHD